MRIILVIIFVLMPQVLHAQELWRGLSYGDSKQHVAESFPKAKATSEGGFSLNGFGDAPCELSVNFKFSKMSGGLSSVYVATSTDIVRESEAVRASCAKKILNGLIEKYGNPSDIGFHKGKNWNVAYWDRKNGIFIEFNYILNLGVRVEYSKNKPFSIDHYKNANDAL